MQDDSQSSRILVVDDEEMNRDMLSRRLRRKGYTVDCADGAAEADRRLEEASVDLVLLDIMMPGVDGFEYLEQLRKRSDSSQLPVIMATAKVGTEDIVRALKMGANDYVTKPLDFEIVMARVETQLRLKHTTERLAEAHRLLQYDLRMAARFQQSLLPSKDLTVPGCRFAWHYQPCDALAGDFLDVVPLDPFRTAFYVLDVSGHGTAAALMSAAVGRTLSVTGDESSVVSSVVREGIMGGRRIDVVPPREVTARLNRQFLLDTRDGKYFTMAYVIIDTEAKEMTYTLAGHPPQIFVPSGRASELMACDGVPIGLLSEDEIPEDSFQQVKVQISSGDRIYLYSDGLSESANAADEQFENARIRDVIDQSRSLSIDDTIAKILESIREFCGGKPFDDDMSMMAIEIE
jgi:sigma-B regulation protein RsbU (phosphoserine phosphatase)